MGNRVLRLLPKLDKMKSTAHTDDVGGEKIPIKKIKQKIVERMDNFAITCRSLAV